MQAQRRSESDPRLRAVATVLICLLGCALLTAARTGDSQRHVARAAVVLTASVTDTGHGATRGDVPGDLAPGVPAGAVLIGPAGTADSSTSTDHRTAQPPQVRGPPGQALA